MIESGAGRPLLDRLLERCSRAGVITGILALSLVSSGRSQSVPSEPVTGPSPVSSVQPMTAPPSPRIDPTAPVTPYGGPFLSLDAQDATAPRVATAPPPPLP